MISKLKPCLIALGICSAAFSVACTAKSESPASSSTEKPSVEKGQQDQKPLSVGQTQSEEDVAKLLERESGNLLVLGTKWKKTTPKFLRGDFNGDGAGDIAIAAAVNAGVKFDTQPLSAFVIDKAFPPDDQ